MGSNYLPVAFCIFAVYFNIYVTSAASSIGNDTTLFRATIAKIEAMTQDGELPSMALGVMKADEILLERSFGFANVQDKIKATPETLYTLGSLSKSVTATGIMVLVQEGRIALDVPVNKYLNTAKLTNYKGIEQDVTVQSLLNCTAAIPHGWYMKNMEEEDLSAQEYIEKFGKVVFSDQETYLYSNHAYGIAAILIEEVSGKSYEDFMREKVFDPLKMHHTYSRFDKVKADDVAVLYDNDNAVIKYGTYTGPIAGAGLYSSLNDMMRYGALHMGNTVLGSEQILTTESLDTMHYTKNHENPYWFMALGWHELKLDENTSVLISNGEVVGGNATMIIIPEEEIMVVALANKAFSRSISDQISFEVLETLLPGFMEKLGGMIGQYEANVYQAYEPTADLIGRWEGTITYTDRSKTVFLDFKDNGSIIAGIEGQMMTILNDPIYEHGTLKAKSFGYLDWNTYQIPREIQYNLRKRNNVMYGYMAYVFDRIADWQPEFAKSTVHTAFINLKKNP